MNDNIENFGPPEMKCEHAQWYTISDFAELVCGGIIKDGEGFGYYAREDKISSVRVVLDEFIEDEANKEINAERAARGEDPIFKGTRERMNGGKYVVWHPND